MANNWLLSLLLSVILSSVTAEDPCDFYMSVDITNGYALKSGSIMHNGLVYAEDQRYVHEDEDGTNRTRGCICSIKPCMRKCCPLGQALVGRSCADSQDPKVNPFSPFVYSLDKKLPLLKADRLFGLVFDNPCAEGRIALNPYASPGAIKDRYFLQRIHQITMLAACTLDSQKCVLFYQWRIQNGYLYIPGFYSEPRNLSQMFYCMDAFPKAPMGYSDARWKTRYLPLICVEDDLNDDDYEDDESIDNDIFFIAFFIGIMISIPFLLATFLVYAIIPELQNLHGKALMSYIVGLILAYVFLAIDQTITRQTSVEISEDVCLFLAFSLYFFFLVSFFWVNVMCFDIWWTFRSSICTQRHGRQVAERRRFTRYCLYAWGTPLLLTAIAAMMQFLPSNLPDSFIRPNFGEIRCWFSDWKAQLLYFSIPVIILVICNLTLFACTSYNILKINRETAMLENGDSARNDQLNKEKQRFHIYLKLFLVMGVNWMAEMLSFVLGGSNYIWIITDLCNTMLGVFIFIIFVWKENVRILLIKRYRMMRTKNSRELTPSQPQLRRKSAKPLLQNVDESTV